MHAAGYGADNQVLRALAAPFASGTLDWPRARRVLFLGARAGAEWSAAAPDMLCQQAFRPFADELLASGCAVAEPLAGARFDLVLALLPRAREARRALFARALDHLDAGGILVVAVANSLGARSAESDLNRLAGPLQHLSKHKCRVFWTAEQACPDAECLDAWREAGRLRSGAEGLLSRPGVFAADRVDPASALLASVLPVDLSGRVADPGAGNGYLSVQLLRHHTGVEALDLYEADADALHAAERNVEDARRAVGRDVACTFHWHDVTRGLGAHYDHVVCNPPFHQGREDLPQLGRAFIAAAADALCAGGHLWLVANRHLAYEHSLRARFDNVVVRVERDGFKVIEAW